MLQTIQKSLTTTDFSRLKRVKFQFYMLYLPKILWYSLLETGGLSSEYHKIIPLLRFMPFQTNIFFGVVRNVWARRKKGDEMGQDLMSILKTPSLGCKTRCSSAVASLAKVKKLLNGLCVVFHMTFFTTFFLRSFFQRSTQHQQQSVHNGLMLNL